MLLNAADLEDGANKTEDAGRRTRQLYSEK
jgi:hypothetical protein